jgi:hypothetical protein
MVHMWTHVYLALPLLQSIYNACTYRRTETIHPSPAQDPDTEIDITRVVFNTEAHPMRIFDDTHTPIPPQ